MTKYQFAVLVTGLVNAESRDEAEARITDRIFWAYEGSPWYVSEVEDLEEYNSPEAKQE